MLEELTEVGAKGHDFEYLKSLLKARHPADRKKRSGDAQDTAEPSERYEQLGDRFALQSRSV